MPRRLLTLFLFVLASLTAARAEDPAAPSKLPLAGSWVKYYVITTGPNIVGESTSVLTLKFLDRVQEQGRDCRWIELQAVPTPDDPARPRSVNKLLIPEDALLQQSNPCRFAVRMWHQHGQEPAQSVETLFGGKAFDMEDIFTGPLLLFLPASREKLRRLDEEEVTVDFQRGRLVRAAVCEGQHKAGYNSTVSEYRFDYTVDCRVKLHDDLPCGFAGARFKWIWSAVKPDGTIEFTRERRSEEYLLQDFGVGATSALPDSH